MNYYAMQVLEKIENDLQFLPIYKALLNTGYYCNINLCKKLWIRFSQDQCATWMEVNKENIERFVDWIDSGLNQDEAFS